MHLETFSQLELNIFANNSSSLESEKCFRSIEHIETKIPDNITELDFITNLSENNYQIVKYIPIAQIFEKHGAFYALNHAQEQLLLSKQFFKNQYPIYVAVDRWQGAFSFSSFVTLVGEIIESTSDIGRFKIVGPTTAEILDIIGARSETTCHISYIQDVLHELANSNITELSGGEDLLIHKIAVEMNFSVTVSHRINLEELKQNKLNYLPQTFIRDLLFIKNHLCKNKKCNSWFLWYGKRLEKLCEDERKELTPKLLRLMSFARLLLPQSVVIKAPISSCGLSFVKEALDIGAINCGFLGLDKNSAENLGLLTKEDIEAKGLKASKVNGVT